jgi:hypothetical protein
LISELNKNIEKLEIKIGTDVVDKYEMARIGNYEIYQKILEQVTSIKLGSEENLIADFYKRINTDLISFKKRMNDNDNTILMLKETI